MKAFIVIEQVEIYSPIALATEGMSTKTLSYSKTVKKGSVKCISLFLRKENVELLIQ